MDAMNDKDGMDGNLARAFETLDARAMRAAQKVDAERVAAAVLKRLREGDVARPRPTWQLNTVRIAAAVVLLAASAVTVRRFLVGTRDALPLSIQMDSLTSADARAMLRAVDEARQAGRSAFVPSTVTLEDLSEAELRVLLRAMESGGD